jgi:cytochrome P450
VADGTAAPGDGFVPPYPHRPTERLSAWQRLRLARENLIAMFEEGAFEADFASVRLLARKSFLCNSPETVRYAFSTRNDNFERKSPAMRHMLHPLVGDGLIISEGRTWRKRRRIVSPIVHATRLAELAPVMAEAANAFGDRWGGLPEGTMVEVISEMARLTAGIISRTIFGRELRPDQAREVVDGFTEFQHAARRIDLPSLLGMPDWVPRFQRAAVYRAVRRIHRVVDDIVSTRGRADSGDVSVIARLIDARDPDTGEPLDATAIRNEAAVIFLAGHETTANTLSFAWFLLSQASDVEARLHEELDDVLGDRAPSLDDVPRLRYTRAIIEETLRLYPPIPVLAREALRDETVAGHRVPGGSLVMVVPWLLHRHRKLWQKPDHFIPERFLGDDAPTPDKWIYVPFSIGPRVCAGMAFALTEAILCVATLAQRFQLRLAPGHAVMPICRVSLRPGDTLPMTVHRRLDVERARAPLRAQPAAGGCPFHRG